MSNCYQHTRVSEQSVQKWLQVTRVSDWRCPPGGSMGEYPCHPAALTCTPDAQYSATGILPYPRKSDSGGQSPHCPDLSVRCDEQWPDSPDGGDTCFGPCSSTCSDVAGETKCNWWLLPGETPDGLITCPTGADYIAVDYNCYWKITSATVTYQWYVSTDGGATWTALTNTGVYSGVTTNSLAISNSTGLNGYQYECVATCDGGTVTSHAGILTVT